MASAPQFSAEVRARASQVRLMVFDVDGVLTDGSLHYGPEGEMVKVFNVLDGHGIKQIGQAGIATAIISARKSAPVTRRAADLGITHLHQGVHDKLSVLLEITKTLSLPLSSVGFLGDDVIDLPILTRIGFAAGVPNGHPEVLSRVHYQTTASGGRGAAREVCDLLLRAQERYDELLAKWLA
jgi:3-deoxy-D-manno-octulosonate 8-phosphate phosphatase (KDO 8-P phosphatase)